MKTFSTFLTKHSTLIAIILLAIMFVLALGSMWNDSATMDEIAHIPSGYSYMKFQDMRLNPEHPPLIKDLSAVPLLFMKLNFPLGSPSWTEEINGQWNIGPEFLYHSGNNADKIIFWSRIPEILLMLLLGFYIYKWTKELFSKKIGLLALFLYVLSPTVITHGRFVTTDLGAACFMFIATYYFIKFLKKPSWRTVLISGITFGVAQLTKFSCILLLPFFAVLVISAIFTSPANFLFTLKDWFKRAKKFIGYSIIILVIGYLLVGATYQAQMIHYPVQKQQESTSSILVSYENKSISNLIYKMSDKPVLRSYAQYLLGLAMVNQRVSGGNTTYFLGQVSSSAWWYFFPIAFLLKVPLAFQVLMWVALVFAIYQFIKWLKKRKERETLKTSSVYANNFVIMSFLIFLVIYWAVSIQGNLNIGIRHVLPTFPFLYILVASQVGKLLSLVKNKPKLISAICYLLSVILIVWYATTNFLVYPHYLSYFNELIGGPKNGYKYMVDSSLDWGQDLKRLAQFTDKNHIDKIKVDYFGGGDPEYYLGKKYIKWQSDLGPTKGWLAVSATLFQTSKQYPETSYRWLEKYKPVETVGYSILVYEIN